MDSSDRVLEKVGVLPDPAFQRRAVVSLFETLASAPTTPATSRAISVCLTSTSPAVLDQSVRELCRRLPHSVALLELLSALETSPTSSVPLLVKAIGFLSRRTPDPQIFVKVLQCRDEVCDELLRQVVVFVVRSIAMPDGVDRVVEFLRPFLMFAVLKVQYGGWYSVFATDLVESVAVLCCSFEEKEASVSVLQLLIQCLKFLPCRNDKEFKFILSLASCLVDAYVVVLKQLANTEKLECNTRKCSKDLLEVIFSFNVNICKSYGGSNVVAELSHRMLAAHRELGLHYLPEFVIVMLYSSQALTQTEFEYEQLSILKVLVFLTEWRRKVHESLQDTDFCMEELLLVFPLMKLLSSPSKSVKAMATYLLSAHERVLLDVLAAKKSFRFSQVEVACTSKFGSITTRLFYHSWFQEQFLERSKYFLEVVSNKVSSVVRNEENSWIFYLKEYILSTIEAPKRESFTESSRNRLSGVSSFLCTIVSTLIAHPNIGGHAVDAISAICRTDPTVSMPVFLTVLFYCKIFCSVENDSQEVLVKLLEILPSLASHSAMMPLVIQSILPMLHNDTKPVLYATAVRLLSKTWSFSDRCFGSLHGILDTKMTAQFISDRDISISIASSIHDVCKHSPDRGVDLILSISSCIESQDSYLQALGLESLAYLCEADVLDFYSAWSVIAKSLLDYRADPVVACSLAVLLRWGVMDADAYPDVSRRIIQILWEIGTSKDAHPGLVCSKARIAAIESMIHYEVGIVQKNIADFKGKNVELLVSEDDCEVLDALERFEINIINFEHITRRRLVKEKPIMVNKVEKLLGLFPRAIFPSEVNYAQELPGAALFSLIITPKESLAKHSIEELPRLNSVYKNKLLEIAESLQLSRNTFIALISLQSWQAFTGRWMKAASVLAPKSSSLHGNSKVADNILQIMCKAVEDSIPRVAENIILAIGALCMVTHGLVHPVAFTASEFLLKWLLQHEHEQRQWPAAISLGLVCNCFHASDRMQKYHIIDMLLKVLNSSESYLVKGACGIGLGFACQDLLKTGSDADTKSGGSSRTTEAILLGKIIRSLSLAINRIYDSCDLLKSLSTDFPVSAEDEGGEAFMFVSSETCDTLDEDVWGAAGLILGLGDSLPAIYRYGAYDAAIKIKDAVMSWIPQPGLLVQNTYPSDQLPQKSLSIGSLIALPSVVVFCQRTELARDDLINLLCGYSAVISEILTVKNPGRFHQDILMASCIGTGSLLSYIVNNGFHLLKIDDVKNILEVLRSTYSLPYAPSVHFFGMLGVANSFGAEAGLLKNTSSQVASLEKNNVQMDSSYLYGPILRSQVLEPLCTSIVQEMFIIAKDHSNQQRRKYAAWVLSFLRQRWWPTDFPTVHQSDVVCSTPIPLAISKDTVVWKLYLWLLHLKSSEVSVKTHVSTIKTVLSCLKAAPRLPISSDWGSIISRCMRYAAQHIDDPNLTESCKILREECIKFSVAHANVIASLLSFVDEQADLARFNMLEPNLKSALLYSLPGLVKVFSVQRWEKLCSDLLEYFCSPTSSYTSYEPEQRRKLRISFWNGVHQCLGETSEAQVVTWNIEKCMHGLFDFLPVITSETSYREDLDSIKEEWSVAILCLAKAKPSWVMDTLKVAKTDKHGRGLSVEVMRRILAIAKLVGIGHLPISELEVTKYLLLITKSKGSWSVILEVAEAVSHAEGKITRQWLLDAIDICIMSRYPSTALQFVGILCGVNCKYMPLLILDPVIVVNDLAVTLSSLVSTNGWDVVSEMLVAKFYAATERIYSWAMKLHGEEGDVDSYGIDATENHLSIWLAKVLRETCVSLKHYLPFEKQLRLANMRDIRVQSNTKFGTVGNGRI